MSFFEQGKILNTQEIEAIKQFAVTQDLNKTLRGHIGYLLHKVEHNKPISIQEMNRIHALKLLAKRNLNKKMSNKKRSATSQIS
ncbi:hypothetical protein CEY16_13970 [Halalkalibacillus sediminis]|uniref:Uncharacterized protein n=1 Tax=Halalkalibacillus sediminis TaxID=2018042 RepID=A0A2I0QRE9_9BACI|nr:hypothetical protein [Halalkalibacillus sediminis]PKR76908.1 hypothetical protein CEY16_13970 [Halalkalibacillus sediminis]